MFYYITKEVTILEINGVAKGLKEEVKGKKYNLYTSSKRFDSTNVFYKVSKVIAEAFKNSPYLTKKKKREYTKAFKHLQLEAMHEIDLMILKDDSKKLQADKKSIKKFNIEVISKYTKFADIYQVLQQEV